MHRRTRPCTYLNCFVLDTLSSEAKQLRNVLGHVLGQTTRYKICPLVYIVHTFYNQGLVHTYLNICIMALELGTIGCTINRHLYVYLQSYLLLQVT